MLAIEIEFLTGRYVATEYNDRGRAEWPPHPARLYSAFVATWAEDEGTEAEREALTWLERQAPPRIVASEAARRTVAPVFVPVNDLQTVSEPEGAREGAGVWGAAAAATWAEAQAAGDGKQQKKAETALKKARAKLESDTAKATAGPSKVTAEDMRSVRSVLPETRMRQPRTFPSVAPEDPRVLFVWEVEAPPATAEALTGLCRRVTRLGHSSSLVRAAVRAIDALPEAPEAYVPDDAAADQLRVPGEGQWARLEDAYGQHQGVEPRVLPTRFARYRRGEAVVSSAPGTVFGEDWIVFERVDGDRLPMTRTVDIAEALRGGLLSHAGSPAPSALTGHREHGGPKLEQPHVAFVPLPYVGSEYAKGELMGLALVLPRDLSVEDRRAVMAAVAAWEDAKRGEDDDDDAAKLRLWSGRWGAFSIRRVAFGQSSRRSLRAHTWCEESQVWATATPIALDRNPGDLQADDPKKRAAAFAEAEATVARACAFIGLPEPVHVEVSTSVVLTGSMKPRLFPPFPREREKHRRVLVHARLVFAAPVRGPVILGAGRYFGLGLCRPLTRRDGDE